MLAMSRISVVVTPRQPVKRALALPRVLALVLLVRIDYRARKHRNAI
jgi:hypothetical protein